MQGARQGRRGDASDGPRGPLTIEEWLISSTFAELVTQTTNGGSTQRGAWSPGLIPMAGEV
jgi:hypothetical protein